MTLLRPLLFTSGRGARHAFSRQLSQLGITERGAPVDLLPEVRDALATHKPVVALETAVVTHGMPYPDNLELANSLENIIRSTGAVPATIGLVGGRVKIGLQRSDLECLADTSHTQPAKVSRRDIAPAIAMKAHGGTTCSATLLFAAMAGIKVFSTGGLGGVHRMGQDTMDVSADLHELTRCPVGLISSGIKSILDIGRTLEYLETLGVPVLTYGSSREFPAFFSRHSGFEAPWNVTDPMTAANVLYTQWQLGFQNGALIAIPIPPEYEEAGLSIQRAVDQAVAESEANGISRLGKEATPWLLSRVVELTGGSSLASNIALLKNTALFGGNVAVEYHKLAGSPDALTTYEPIFAQPSSQHFSLQGDQLNPAIPADLVIVGSAAIDIISQAQSDTGGVLASHSTIPGTVSMSLGGVARNIAEAAHRVTAPRLKGPSSPCVLISPVGDDAFGRTLIEQTSQLGMRVDGFIQAEQATAVCNMVLGSDGGLQGGVAAMDITTQVPGNTINAKIQAFNPRIVTLDGNLSHETILMIVNHCIENHRQIFFEPTSTTKSTAVLPAVAASLHHDSTQAPITFFSPNILELKHIDYACRTGPLDLYSHPRWWQGLDSLNLGPTFRQDLERLAKMPVTDDESSSKGALTFLIDEGVAQMGVKLLPFFQHLIIKCGDRGVFVVMRIASHMTTSSLWEDEDIQLRPRRVIARGKFNDLLVMQHFPPLAISKITNVTGAGDSFVGVLLASLLQDPAAFQNPKGLSDVISAAQKAAILSLQSDRAVSPILSAGLVHKS